MSVSDILSLETLRKKYGKNMTEHQCDHIEGVIKRFAERAYEKYAAGQEEHGGDLWRKDIVLEELKSEAIDFVVYALTLEDQIKRSGAILGERLPDVEKTKKVA